MRECGDCTACCGGALYLTLGEHKIHRGSPCPYICKENNNCSIHQDRPDICRNFECFWKANESVPEWLKPSQSGVILSYSGQKNQLDAYAVEGMEVKLGTLFNILQFVHSHNLTLVFNINDSDDDYFCGVLNFSKNHLYFETFTRQQIIETTAKLA